MAEITWLGHSCFRIKGRGVTILMDPYDRSVGYNLGRVTADIVTVSHEHNDHNNVKGVTGQPRLVRGPGEYEIAGVFITGIATNHDAARGAQRGKNTVYLVELEELVFCHLGDLGHVLNSEQVEAVGDVDVLMVPVGGHYTIDGTQAAEVVSQIEPRIVIPMHYRTDAVQLELEPLDRFCKEMGLKDLEPQAKLVVSKSSAPDELQVVVLDYKS